jgi:hypothetical protein
LTVFWALEQQFLWADTVMVTADGFGSHPDDGEVLDGEVGF